MLHPLSDVQSIHIGDNTHIWQFTVVLPGAVIGSNCNICSNCFIENDVFIGDNVTVKSGVQLWDGLHVEDNVFIGPNVTFSNDLYPRSKGTWQLRRTGIGKGASIGANATILAGCSIGQYAMIGAGSVVTKDIAPYTLWYGNPARQKGFVTKEGIIISTNMTDSVGSQYKLSPEGEPLKTNR